MQDKITRAIIESCADKWIDDIRTDTHRAARKLTELGGLWSHSGKQRSFFSGIDDLLCNDRSTYYDLTGALANTVKKENLKRFSLNFGCNALGAGAKKLREAALAGHPAAWTAVLTVDETTPRDALTRFVSDCRETGDYLFFVDVRGNAVEAVRALCAQFPDCAFILFAENCTDALALAAKNALVAPPFADPLFARTKDMLRENGVLYGAFTDDPYAARSPQALAQCAQEAAAMDVPFLLLRDTSDASSALDAFRAAPPTAVFPVALPQDLLQVGRRIEERALYFEVGADGTAALRTEDGATPLPNVFGTPFGLVLRKIR